MKRIATLATSIIGATALSVSSAMAQLDESVETEAGSIAIEKLADGLDHPWGMAFLPDGRLLVTERAGDLRILDKDNKLSDPVKGVPEVFTSQQGGLLDVALDPDFKSNKYVYLSFSEPGDKGASTAVGRGQFENDEIKDFQVIFSQTPKVEGPNHFGGRLVFSQDGKLFITTGDRYKFDPAQDLSGHMGKILRINPDGSAPEDNPFIDQEEARDEIWSYGHRNVQSAGIDPATGSLWIAEMGPLGGDELNMPEAGKNYGWPEVSWGKHYDGKDIPDPDTRPEFTDAVKHWTPVISPSGMLFYSGEMFPEWKESTLIGGLSALGVVRVKIDNQKVTHEERIPIGVRIRDVEQAPDGSVYLLTDEDDGKILQLKPLEDGEPPSR